MLPQKIEEVREAVALAADWAMINDHAMKHSNNRIHRPPRAAHPAVICVARGHLYRYQE